MEMSRNLGSTVCAFCYGTVVHEEEARPITETEARCYFDEYRGMSVANAHCEDCEAQYLAWVATPPSFPGWAHSEAEPGGHIDLSHRSSFNDEPGEADLPTYRIEVRRVRVGPWVSD